MAALDFVVESTGHVVAQIIEPELIVGAVGDVGGVVDPLLRGALLEPGDDQPHLQAHPVVDPAHPLGVEAGKVVVDRHQVHALAAETIEVGGQGADKGLALSGLHLGHPAEMEGGTAHQLDVEVALTDYPAGGFAHHRESLDEEVVECLATVDAVAELVRLGPQGLVGERLDSGFVGVDVGDEALEGLELLAFTSAEDAIEDAHAGSDPTVGAAPSLAMPSPLSGRETPSPLSSGRGTPSQVRVFDPKGARHTALLDGVAAAAMHLTSATPARSRACLAARMVAPVVTTSSTTKTLNPARGARTRKSGPLSRSERERPVWGAP